MIVFENTPITTTYSSIPLEKITAFNKNAAYIKEQLTIYDNKIYSALTDITPTVQFVWNSTDTANKYGYDLYNDITIPDPTSVYCTTNTIVWSIRNKKYYSAKADGYVNFTTQDPLVHADFNDLGATPTPLYRTSINLPNGKKDTLYWEYVSSTTQNTMFDKVVNKRATNDRSFTTIGTTTFNNSGTMTLSNPLSSNIYVNDKIKISGTLLNDGYYKILSISVDRLTVSIGLVSVAETITSSFNIYTQTYIKWSGYAIDKIAVFNTICDYVELEVSNGDTTEFINTFELFCFNEPGNNKKYTLSLRETEFINTFELFCFNEPIDKMKNIINLDKTFSQEFELTFFGNTQEIGEVIQGTSYYLGRAEDSTSLTGKNYNPLVEATNGDIYLTDETSPIDVLDEKQINVIYDSNLTSTLNNKMKTLMSKNLVISGDAGDKEDLSFLLTYGFIRDYNFNPEVNHELNKFTFTTREFL